MIIGISSLFIAINSVQRQNEHLSVAARAGETKIESLRNNHYNSLAVSPPAIDFTSELPSELPEPRSGTVTVSEPSPGLKRLDLQITYFESGRNKTVKMSTLIGNIGISQWDGTKSVHH